MVIVISVLAWMEFRSLVYIEVCSMNSSNLCN